MLSLLAALKTLKSWQIMVLVVALFGAGAATYAVYANLNGQDRAGLAEDQQLIPVRLGNLVNQVSTNGNLAFPERESLTFGSQGTVEEVLVDEGQSVTRGQVLARLDRITLAALNQSVAQARVDLQDAQDSLAELQESPVLALAQARQEVADAEFQIETALETLADTVRPYTQQDIKAQEELVASARLSLREAGQALADLAPDHAQLVAQVRQARADAELALQNARDSLADLAPDHIRETVKARQTKADAEVAFDQALTALADFQPDYNQDLVQARQARADAEVALDEALTALADFQPDYDEDLVQARQAKADAELAAKRAQDTLDSYETANGVRLILARAEKTDAEALLEQTQEELLSVIRLAESGVPGLTFEIQRLREVVEVRLSGLEQAQDAVSEVEQLEAAVELAAANLETARVDLSVLEKGPDAVKRQQLETVVDSARADLNGTKEDLADLEQGVDSAQRQQLEAAVEQVRADLDKAQEDLARLEEGLDLLKRQQLEAAVQLAMVDLQVAIDSQEKVNTEANPDDVDLHRGNVAAAVAALGQAEQELVNKSNRGSSPAELLRQEKLVAALGDNLATSEDALAAILAGVDFREAALRTAEVSLAGATLTQAAADLEELLEGFGLVEVTLRQEEVAVARAVLAEAEDDLADLLAGPDSLEVALQEAQTASAQLELDNALELVEKAVIRAPMNGFVSVVDVEAGDEVGPNARIVEIVDPTVVEVDGIVDEIDVLLIREGVRAAVTLDSLPGQTLEGTVSEIAPAALNQQGVVTYPIRIQVQVPDGVQLREGLSATAEIIIQEEKNVLLVPQQALRGSFEQPVVQVMTNGGIQERRVVLGNSDDFWTAIREGLEEGDQVVMSVAQTTSDPFAAFRQLRGGFGGGRR